MTMKFTLNPSSLLSKALAFSQFEGR